MVDLLSQSSPLLIIKIPEFSWNLMRIPSMSLVKGFGCVSRMWRY